MASLTQDIGTFISDLRYDHLPAVASPIIRNGFTDFVATVLLGRDDEVTNLVRKTLVGHSENPEARLLLSSESKSGISAALVNGTASHSQDYDDVGLVGIQPTHPSASIAPAIFAEAETLRRDGRAMVCAYAAAFEVWGELASRDLDPVHVKGWHPTGTFGAIAAAAAAASLHGLSANAAAHAVSLAASMAAGVIANFGSMAKPYHAGRAAQSGVIAARLAAAGMTASDDALESHLGFLAAISPKGRVDRESPAGFGGRWFLESHGLGFKLFPIAMGRTGHSTGSSRCWRLRRSRRTMSSASRSRPTGHNIPTSSTRTRRTRSMRSSAWNSPWRSPSWLGDARARNSFPPLSIVPKFA